MNCFKKVLSIILTILLIFTVVGCSKDNKDNSSSTDTATYEYEYRDLAEPVYLTAAEKFAAGNGTAEDPYQISTPEELAYLSVLINDSKTSDDYRKANYKLTSDIIINDGTTADTWSATAPQYSWNPIGIYYYSFQGIFDGAGHKISGLYINVDCRDNQTGDKYGLFGNNDGTIKDLNVENSYICISGLSKDIGSIAGDNGKDGKIINCSSKAIYDCYDAICGGIVGNNDGLVEKSTFSGSINELRTYTYNCLGGISGKSSGKISNCVNNGKITSGITAIEYAGGIVGRLSDGTIEGCTNNGTIDCDNGEIDKDKSLDVYGNEIGGIVGCLFSSRAGAEEYRNKDIYVRDCINNAEVSGGMSAAGIIASANNSGSDYSVVVSGCTNNGKIVSTGNQAGIIADAACSGSELTVTNCKNTANISDGFSAGIISKLTPSKGNVNIKNCLNEGDIKASELYAGGIIRTLYLFGDIAANINVDGCSNAGKITTPESAGGIIGFINSTATSAIDNDAKFVISNCNNKGEIFTQSSNSYIGGIVGGFGVKGLSSEIKGCINSGTLSVEDKEPSDETVNSDKTMNLSRMCGGIIGRIGETLYLSTSADKGDEKNVNAKEAVIKISDCYSNGSFNVPAEDKYKNKKGDCIWDNQLGGIVGNCSAADGYSFSVDNCGFANIERGLGTKTYDDIAKAMDSSAISAKIK